MPLLIQRASAGSGKTEQLARRYLQILLAKDSSGHEVDPATIVAATFTREAAGEILARILKMVAMACHEELICQRIVEGTTLQVPTCLECQQLLRRLIERIHRLRIGTIDALFAQQARAFVLDLGLAPHWKIADALTAAELARKTLLRLLEHDPLFAHDWKIVHYFKRSLSFVEAAALLLEKNRSLVHAQPWEEIPEEKNPPLLLSVEERVSVQQFFSHFQLPTTEKGKPSGHWVAALKKLQGAFAQPLYLKEILDLSSLFSQLLEEEPSFYGKKIPEEFVTFFSPLAKAAQVEQRRLALLREGALHRLAQGYHDMRRRFSFQAGRYTFSEIEEVMSAASQELSKEEVEFRMELRTEHLLLDEYQDTSQRQHEFLFPLIGDVLAKGGWVFVVGDVKQGIYGWRGGKRHLLGFLEKAYEPYLQKTIPLHQSYRSSPAILEAVNQTFEALKDKEAVARMQAGEAFEIAAARWSADFQPQESAASAASLRGEVVFHEIPIEQGELQEDVMPQVVQKVVQLVEDHQQKDSLREVAILVRRTKFIPSLLLKLRERGILASGEGGNPLADTLAVEVLLSLLSWINHPGYNAAYEHVRISPLADLLEEHAILKPTEVTVLREMIVNTGYAKSLRAWASRPLFQKACSDYEKARIEQLIAMAHQFDALGGGTPSELVKQAREERVESPLSRGVRVLSMHAAKGLEFESVILMDLDTSIFGRAQDSVRVQTTSDGKFFIQTNQELMTLQGREKLLKELQEEQWEEALSLLYVAMTRAIAYLDIVVAKDSRRTTPKKSMAEWLHASGLKNQKVDGLSWHDQKKRTSQGNFLLKKKDVSFEAASLQRLPTLVKRSPSKEQEGGLLSVAEQFYDPKTRSQGIIKHALLAKVEWLEDFPSHEIFKLNEALQEDEEFLAVFQRTHFFSQWKKWGVTRLEVWQERRFAVVQKQKKELLTGTFDRVIIGYAEEPLVAVIIDFKTTPLTLEEKKSRLDRYQGQLEGYRMALQHLLPTLQHIETRIVWI